jgi:tetratricopeptide (TPR) repeat protein
MLAFGGRSLTAIMLAGAAATAGAQQKACDVDEGTPNQVARAVLDLQLAQNSSKPEDAAAKLRDAVKLLTEGDVKKNPAGRAMVLGKTLVLWSAQPSVANGMSTRGAIGFTTDPTAPYDVIAGIDSAFTVVETANPECATQTAGWRQQKGWVDLVNQAIELANADKADSAMIVAKRSLQLSHTSPYGFMVLAQATAAKASKADSASRAAQAKQAITLYKQAIAAAEKDTAQTETRRQMQFALGTFAVNFAEMSSGADKTAFMQEAKAAFDALSKDPGTKYADAARTGQARIATLTGDTAAIKGSYSEQLANPSAFSYNSLMQAAVTAARANQVPDAIKLFEAARAVNPQHRDVLYNLARLYLLDSAYSKGIPIARQLVAVDPSNPDNYSLIAIAYANAKKGYDAKVKDYEAKAKALGQRANTSKSAAVVKAAVDSAARLTPLIKTYQDSAKIAVDSAIKYNTAGTALPAKVEFTEFTPTDAKTTIGGSLTNQTDAAKSFTFKIEFVDKTGNVVTTQDVSVGPVQPHQSSNFNATATGAGIVAFRYKPIT